MSAHTVGRTIRRLLLRKRMARTYDFALAGEEDEVSARSLATHLPDYSIGDVRYT